MRSQDIGSRTDSARSRILQASSRRHELKQLYRQGNPLDRLLAADDGALLGEHDVAIAKAIRRKTQAATGATLGAMADPMQFSESPIEFFLPPRYSNIQTSALSATVETGKNTF